MYRMQFVCMCGENFSVDVNNDTRNALMLCTVCGFYGEPQIIVYSGALRHTLRPATEYNPQIHDLWGLMGKVR